MLKFFLLFLILIFYIHAENTKFDLEGKTALFFAKSTKFKKIYEIPIPSYQIEGCFFNKWWNNFSYLNKKGKSDPLNISTSLQIFSFSSGIKHNFFKSANQNLNLGIGIVYSWLEEKNKAFFAKRVKRKNGLGGIIKFEVSKIFNFFDVSVFSDYQIQTFKAGNSLENIKVNISGVYLGFAIGCRY